MLESIEQRLLFSSAPPVLTPERPLPGDTTAELSVGQQTNPSLAEGPNGVSLAVWQDTRSGGNPNVYGGVGLGTMTDIYAARVRADGSVIDVTPIPISISSYNQNTPKASWNGTNWLLAWNTQRSEDFYQTDITAVRVSQAGVVLDAAPMIVATHLPNPFGSDDIDPTGPMQVLSDGTDWQVVWRRHNPNLAGGIGMEWFATKVLANGNIPSADGVKILSADQYTNDFGLAFSPINGGQYLHGFDFNSTVQFERYDRNMQLVTGSRRSIPGGEFIVHMSVAGGPAGWILSWEEDTNSWQRVLASRVGTAGTLIDATPLDLTDYMYAADVSLDAKWNGVDWAVVYSGSGPGSDFSQDLFLRRIDPVATGGAAFKTGLINIVPTPEYQGQPQLVSSGDGGFKMLYTDQATTKPGISVAVVSPGDQLLGRADVSLAAPSQGGSEIASDGTHILMVFSSSTAYGTRLMGQRVRPDGTAVDQQPFVLADRDMKVTSYEVVYMEGRYVVTFGGETAALGKQIFARNVGIDGTVGGLTALMPNAAFTAFSLSDAAANGNRMILVGNANEGNSHRSSRFFRIFDNNLQAVSARTQIDYGFALGGDTEPVNGGWMAAWASKVTHDAPRAGVQYANIGLDGTIRGQGVAAETWPDTNSGNPTVVSNGESAATEAMVMYFQRRDPINPQMVNADGIRAQRIAADGTKIGGQITLIDEPGLQTQPAAVFDGTNYVMSWTDQRNYPYPAQARDDIYAARVSVDGTVIDAGGFPVADSFRPEMHGDIGVAGGQVMFAYRTFRHEAPWGSYRLATRGTPTVETTPPTLVAGTPFEHERDQAVVFRFDKPLMGVDAADVVVRNTTTGATIASNLFGVQVIAANTQSWTYRWVYSGGILPNGNYTATLLAGSVTDLAGNATTQDQTGNFRVLMGDADDNGRIDGADYALIDAGFNQQLSGWSNGDFNYDGKIDGMDYALIDAAFNAQSAPPVQGKPGKAGTGGLRK